ncbi:MAG: glutathione S-transferase family protein [Porticoccaceae bacterium]|nr:glutathione S-transferase family protein [Porticoccaceae bacterium]
MSIYTDPILVIGNKNYSSWSLRPWLAIRKAGVHVELKRLPLDTEEFAREVGKYSPTGKVPVLIDDTRTVWDSLAICEYVSENMDEGHLWPPNFAERAWARSISAEMHSGFNHLRNAMPMNARATGRTVAITDGLEKDIARINQIWTECRQKHAHIGPWLFGGFTVADAMYAPVVLRFNTYGVSLRDEANQYMQHVLNDGDVKQWMAEAAEETEVVEADEAGA